MVHDTLSRKRSSLIIVLGGSLLLFVMSIFIRNSALAQEKSDLLHVSFLLNKSGHVELGTWSDFEGFPSTFSDGGYKFQVRDQLGEVLTEYPVSPAFWLRLEGHGQVEKDSAVVHVGIPYGMKIASVQFLDEKETVLFDIDPVIKIFSDTISEIMGACSLDTEEQDWASGVTQRFEKAVQGQRREEAIHIIQNEAEPFLNKYRDKARVHDPENFKRDDVTEYMADYREFCPPMLDLSGERLMSQVSNITKRLEVRFPL